MLPDAARRHHDRQASLAAAALLASRSTWGQLTTSNLDDSWDRLVGPRLVTLTASTQRAMALDAIDFVPEVLAELGIDAPPAGRVAVAPFVGIASDGRPLDTLLREPLIHTKSLIGVGVDTDGALAGGLAALERIVQTQLADAARAATSVGIASRPRVGYVRMLNTPSCSRCAVLAGKWFRYNQGFQRHPRCDCRHIPATEDVAGDLTTDPRKAIEQGQVTGLSKADTRAILEDHADVGQVINSRRGMTPAGTTLEGTTRRGFAGKRLAAAGDDFTGTRTSRYRRASTTARLRPEAIYRLAGSREEAIELLRRHGYLI